MISLINDDNYLTVAMKYYENPHCKSIDEFKGDLDRVSYIKRHIKKYIVSKKIKERLLLNHIIIFCNVFTVPVGIRLLFNKLSPDMYPVLKTFLVFLNYVDDTTTYIPECFKPVSSIPVDDNLLHLLSLIDGESSS